MSGDPSVERETPGAIESNAGDDYHILWACRRCLRLLEPQATLSLVMVEGLSRDDEQAAENADSFLGVDLTEYSGGESFEDADSVVFSQLKYSQRHPDRPWTASRLCEAVRGKKSNSVMARLAQAFSGFYKPDNRAAVIERLRIKLVSNRPTDKGIEDALKAARSWLDSVGPEAPAKAAQLIAGVGETHQRDIRKLRDASGLKSADFCDFLRCLDLSDCNSDGRLWQRLRLIQELGRLVPASPAENARELYQLVAQEALPTVGPRGLKRADILAALGCHGEKDLFPALPCFERNTDLVATPDAERIVQALQVSSTRRLLAHGAGGVGKTTAVLSLPDRWPDAHFLFYDCFGEATYRDSPGDERHSPQRALLQLSNQLAVDCGSPFLVRPPSVAADLWRQFRDRLSAAGEILQQQNESLILVIDAADNAIQAADTPGDSFVIDLWKTPLPTNVYLLMTARSGGRAQSLHAPGDTPTVKLTGFDANASAEHLRRSLGAATDEDAREFHDRSHGNPRVQTYALQAAGPTADMQAILHHARRSLEDIFQDYVIAAHTLSFCHGEANQHLDDLVCFPRPLRLTHLTEVFGLPQQEIEALCGALSPGLSRAAEGWRFRDEDFDTFLHEQLDPRREREANDRLAQHMAALPNSDFAARHHAEHLFRAGNDDAVIDLAMAGDAAIAIGDEVARVKVQRRRLALGVKSAVRANRHEELVRLTVLAADSARSDRAILKLIADHPALAALYADPKTIAKYHLEAESQGWFGGAQLRCAALFSRDPERHAQAKEHSEMAEAWLRRWMARPEQERQQWTIEARDIAAGGEASLRLYGPDAAVHWMRRWRPFDSVLRACRWLANSVASEIPANRQLELYRAIEPHPLVAALFLVAFHRHGEPPSQELVETVTVALENYARLNRRRFVHGLPTHNPDTDVLFSTLGIGFGELLAEYGIEAGRIARLLEYTGPIEPGFPPYRPFHTNRFARQLQTMALLAELTGQEPDKAELERRLLKHHEDSSEHQRGEECRQFHELVDPSFRLYRLRAEALVRRPEAVDLLPRLTDVLNLSRKEQWHDSSEFDFFYRDAIPLAADAALACRGSVGEFLDQIAEEIAQRFGDGAPSFWIDLGDRLSSSPKHVRRTLALIDRAATYLAEHPINGDEHCAALLRAAALVQRHDRNMGADLFHQAIAVAREMNDDLSDRLDYLARSAEGLRADLDEEGSRDLGARLTRLTEETRIYVTDGDRYPWASVFRTVSALHAPSGYALFTRWDDLDHLGIRGNVHELVLSGLHHSNLTPIQAMALLCLGSNESATVDTFLAILGQILPTAGEDTANFRDMLGCIISWVLRDLSREERPNQAQILQDWLKEHDCEQLPEARPLRDYLAFISDNTSQDESSSRQEPYEPESPSTDEVDWDDFFGAESIPPRLPALLHALGNVQRGYSLRETFFAQARARLLPSERPAYLQALVELPDKRVYMDEDLSEWETCLGSWGHSPAVTQWAESGMVELAQRHLPGILGYPFNANESLDRFLSLPLVRPEKWLELLAPALADWVERLDAWQLYPLTESLARGLAAAQRKELLDEALTRGERAIEQRQRKALPPPPAWPLYGADHGMPLASLLHTLTGHPDTRIRWSCLHALREMRLQDDSPLLAALIARLDALAVDGFLPADSQFLWISARAYLLIFLARFAQDQPAALIPHVDSLLAHALSTDFPHAQIRELAKRALLTIEREIPGSINAEGIQRLEKVNVPLAVVASEVERSGWPRNNRHEGRFHFNPIDTLPYWYAPLGRRFGLSAGAIATMAESWICDRWGVVGDQVRQCRRKRHGDQSWRLTDNSHGTLPIVEECQLYYEYHAMHLVAGGLIDSRPVSIEHGDWDSDTWEYWLRGHLTTRTHYWLSELRDPTPLEPQFHGFTEPLDPWLIPSPPDAFDACLGLIPEVDNNYLVVATQVNIHAHDRREHHSIDSALVSPSTAHALLRALQCIDDPRNYRIPPAGDSLEIEEPGFSLKGWIGHRSGEGALDDRDPLLHGMDTGLPFFPRVVQESLGVHPDINGKRYLDRTEPGRVIAATTAWSDQTRDTEYAEYSIGWRFRIDLQRLFQYLGEQNRCLILEVQIDRTQRSNGRDYYDDKPPTALIYLLYPDGRLETLEHHHHLGPTNR